jgi:hypothetical protein
MMGEGVKKGFPMAVPSQRVLSAIEKAASLLGMERHGATQSEIVPF